MNRDILLITEYYEEEKGITITVGLLMIPLR